MGEKGEGGGGGGGEGEVLPQKQIGTDYFM